MTKKIGITTKLPCVHTGKVALLEEAGEEIRWQAHAVDATNEEESSSRTAVQVTH